MSLLEVWLHTLVASCASKVFVVLILPDPLSSQGLWALPLCPGSPDLQAVPWGKGVSEGREDQTSASTLSGIRFVVSTSVDGGLGARVVCLRNWKNGVPVPTAMAASYL